MPTLGFRADDFVELQFEFKRKQLFMVCGQTLYIVKFFYVQNFGHLIKRIIRLTLNLAARKKVCWIVGCHPKVVQDFLLEEFKAVHQKENCSPERKLPLTSMSGK